MAAKLAEHSAVPFHIGLAEPIDESSIVGRPPVKGGYDALEQIWKLPDGTPLTDPKAFIDAPYETPTLCLRDHYMVDDTDLDY